MLGSAIVQAFAASRPNDDIVAPSRDDVDLLDERATRALISDVDPDVVVHAAAVVAGIAERARHPGRFLAENLRIDLNVVTASADEGVGSLAYIGSAGAYPAAAPQPIREDALLTGPYEPQLEPYGLAKTAGARLCGYVSQEKDLAYRALVPCNLYGPNDHFDSERAHLIPAAIAKVARAAREGGGVEIWGDGTARREYAYSPDVAAWVVDHVADLAALPPLMNLGAGSDHSVREYYEAIARALDAEVELSFDPTRPRGVERRLLDSTLARNLGWSAPTSLDAGLAKTCSWYLEHAVAG